MSIDRKYIIPKFLLVLVSVLLLTLSIIWPLIVHAATTVTESFDNSSGLEELQGVVVNSGSLELSTDGVTYTEDFNSYSDGDVPTNWSRATTNWSVQSGRYIHAGTEYDNSTTVWNGGSVRNGQVSATINLPGPGGEGMGGLVFRYQDSNNYYYVWISSLYDGMSLRKVVNGTTSIVSSIDETLLDNTDYTVKTVFNGNKIQIYLDDVLKITTYDGDLNSAGKVGFWRTGSWVYFDNLTVSSNTYDHGWTTSNTTTLDDNIQSANLTMTGTNLSQVGVAISNDNGTVWQEIIEGQTVYFKSTGTQFKYRVYLDSGTSNPTISQIEFNLQTGVKDTVNTIIMQDMNRLGSSSSPTGMISDSVNPLKLESYATISDTKMVQQGLIARRGGKTVAYIPDSDNQDIFAYDLAAKTKLWTTDLAGYLEGTPFIQNGVVYMGSYDKNLYALDQDSGSVLWTYVADDAISGGNIDIKNNIIYFNDYGYSGTTRLYAVNLTTKSLVWSYSTPGAVFIALSLDQAMDLIFINYSGKIVALKASNGDLVWENDLGIGYLTRAPVIYGDKLLVGGDRGVAVVNKFTGGTNWKVPIGSVTEDGIGAQPVPDGDTMYYPTKNDAKLYARKISNGDLVWTSDVGVTFSTPILTSDGYLYISYNDGVKAFNKIDGSLVWTSSEAGWVENVVSVGHGYLLFTDPAGTGTMYIYRLNQETYTSNNGLTINRDDRIITGITYGSVKSTGFNCDANQLTVPDIGTVTIDYGTYPDGASVPVNIILNPVSSTKVALCRPSGTDTFTYPFGTDSMTDVLRDGSIMSSSSWSRSGNLVTVTDSFSSHTYEATTISSAGAPACDNTAPSTAPYLYSVVPTGTNSVLLKFTEAKDPVDKYVLQFGTESGIYTDGLPNIGGRGTISFEVRFLQTGVNYYFRVRAGNGCATGPWSNELRGSTGGITWASQNDASTRQATVSATPTLPDAGSWTATVLFSIMGLGSVAFSFLLWRGTGSQL